MSATELAEAIRTRQASSAEVVEAHLRRIEAVNPVVNAVVLLLGEQALQAAEAADRALAAASVRRMNASRRRTIVQMDDAPSGIDPAMAPDYPVAVAPYTCGR